MDVSSASRLSKFHAAFAMESGRKPFQRHRVRQDGLRIVKVRDRCNNTFGTIV